MAPKKRPKEDSSLFEHEYDDDRAYCVCGTRTSEMGEEDVDWIGCDNGSKCPIEWFHNKCVGFTKDSVPQGKWYCDECKRSKRTPAVEKAAPVARVFVCEICDAQFDIKEECLQHKEEHFKMEYAQKVAAGSNRHSHSSHRSKSIKPASTVSNSSKKEVGIEEVKPNGQGDPPESPRHEVGDQERVDLNEEELRVLGGFTDDEIISELVDRKAVYLCSCGIMFEDSSLYYLHSACHNTNNPRKCSECDYEASDWYEFTSHFFKHKNKT